MATFALISEGITDQIILQRMIELYVDEHFSGEVFVNPLQPIRDTTDANSAPHGGWEKVFEYCRLKAHDAFEANDYLVIQIDTDVADHENFGVPLTIGGVDRSFNDVVSDTIAVLKLQLGRACVRDFGDRIFFAVSFHSMESWLLLCLYDVDRPKGGYDRLARNLHKEGTRHFSAFFFEALKFCPKQN
jgi:hypothetical protein